MIRINLLQVNISNERMTVKQANYYNIVFHPGQDWVYPVGGKTQIAKKDITPKKILQNGNFLIYYTQRMIRCERSKAETWEKKRIVCLNF